MLLKVFDADRGKARVCLAVFLFGWFNYAAYVLIGRLIGGYASNGDRDDAGHYILVDHAKVTAVGHAIWLYSRWHFALATAGWVVGMAAGVWLKIMQERAKRAAPD
jgi:hypothetical protein